MPDVAGVDRPFDYTVPDSLGPAVRVGTIVRIDLAGRRVGGWVVADGVEPPERLALRPIARVSGWGPEQATVDLAGWAAWRYAGRRNAVLSTASAHRAVPVLPAPDLRPPAPPATPSELRDLVSEALRRAAPAGPAGEGPGSAGATAVLRLPPATDPISVVALVAQQGPTLVVVPSAARAAALASRLRRGGAGVAEVPDQWAAARAGAGVVVGARAAVWAPCPGLAAVVVLDAHDESLVQETAPAWWATTAAAERARRAGVPCVLVTPCPTLDLLALGPVVHPAVDGERAGWALLLVADRRDDDPRLGLYSPQLVRAVRSAERVVCVLNRTGRARLLVCGACRSVARCERCGAAVVQAPGAEAPHPLLCLRCALQRPAVCAGCGSTALRQLRSGVTKVREELEALAGRPVGEVTAATDEIPATGVLVGTEAVLHRAGPADVVAFLDFDQELLGSRLRAGEEALALLARASRLVGGRRRGGRILVQTRLVDHEVIEAARLGQPERVSRSEDETRRALRLPPHAALAVLTGPGAAAYGDALRGASGVEVLGPAGGRTVLRAASHQQLCDALSAVARPAERVRVEVDPVRL